MAKNLTNKNSNNICNRPHAGTCAIIIKDNKILLGKRTGSHGAGTWGFPGGKLETGEEIFDCVKREVYEETGLKVKNLQLGPYTNDVFNKEIHYITLFVLCEVSSGKLQIMEPNKCLEWKWFSWSNLPKQLFLPIQNLVKQGFVPRISKK